MSEQFTADLMQELAADIQAKLRPGLLFALIVFPDQAPGISNYVSSGNRDDMIEALRECADRLEAKEDKPRG